MNREPDAWISKHRETGKEIIDRVKIQSYPVAGMYEHTPLFGVLQRKHIHGGLMQPRTFSALRANAVRQATVTVYVGDIGSELATGLTTVDGTPIDNPFQLPSSGRVTFKAPDGNYRVRLQGPGFDVTEYAKYTGEKESQALDAEMYGSREKFADRRLPNGSVIDVPGLPSILLIFVGIGALVACALYALRFMAESMF